MNNSEKNYNQVPAIKTLQAFEQTARLGNVAKAADGVRLKTSAAFATFPNRAVCSNACKVFIAGTWL